MKWNIVLHEEFEEGKLVNHAILADMVSIDAVYNYLLTFLKMWMSFLRRKLVDEWLDSLQYCILVVDGITSEVTG